MLHPTVIPWKFTTQKSNTRPCCIQQSFPENSLHKNPTHAHAASNSHSLKIHYTKIQHTPMLHPTVIPWKFTTQKLRCYKICACLNSIFKRNNKISRPREICFIRKTSNINRNICGTQTCMYQEVRNVSFSEKFAIVSNEWSHVAIHAKTNLLKIFLLCIFFEKICDNNLKMLRNTYRWSYAICYLAVVMLPGFGNKGLV